MTEAEKAQYPTKQELYQLSGEMDVPIVAMKPYAGGNLLKKHKEGSLKGFLSLTPVQCISYILSFPQVACPVPGFKDVNELNQALAYLNATDGEKDFNEINDSIVANFHSQCIYCNHCQPCPIKIDIAEVTKFADMAQKGMTKELLDRYDALEAKDGNCVHCESCNERCPFGIDSSANMRRAQEMFG